MDEKTNSIYHDYWYELIKGMEINMVRPDQRKRYDALKVNFPPITVDSHCPPPTPSPQCVHEKWVSSIGGEFSSSDGKLHSLPLFISIVLTVMISIL